MDSGIYPCSEFDSRQSSFKDVRRPNIDGIDPIRALLPINIEEIAFDQVPNVLGIVP